MPAASRGEPHARHRVAPGPRVADVLGDRRVEDARLLIDEHDVPPQILERHVLADRDRRRRTVPSSGIEHAQQQVRDRRLAAAARPDDRQPLARRDGERHRLQHLAAPEIDRHAIELDRAAASCVSLRGVADSTTSGGVSSSSCTRVSDHLHRREAGVEPHQRLDRLKDAHLIRHERDERPERERAVDDAVAAVDEDGCIAERQQQARHASRQRYDHSCIVISALDEATRCAGGTRRPRAPARSR